MRRTDREVTDPSEITAIMSRCDVVRIAINTETVPYILPVNFGMEPDGMTIYIHGAMEGTKYGLIKEDNRVSFEMDCSHSLVLEEDEHECTMNYESVIGWGYVDELKSEGEKRNALNRLMRQYHAEDFSYNDKPLPHTRILRLKVEQRTAKCRRKMM